MKLLAALTIVALLAAGGSPAAAGDTVEAVIRELSVPSRPAAAGESLGAPEATRQFYAERSARPAWSDGVRPLPEAARFLGAIRDLWQDGLSPRTYHEDAIRRVTAEIEALPDDPVLHERIAALDLLLTDAFLLLADHLRHGRIDPETMAPRGAPSPEALVALRGALERRDPARALEDLRPRSPDYRALREALVALTAVSRSGGWPLVPPGETLRRGARDARVEALRDRLRASGDLADGATADPDLFDEALERGVLRFQERHGLVADGIAGRATLGALAVSASGRARQVAVNLERLRWRPRPASGGWVMVDAAGFDLRLFDGEREVLAMRAIVGTRAGATPILTSAIDRIILNPYWNVPPRIAAREILPRIRRDPGFLAREGMRVFAQSSGRAVDPARIDWRSVSAADFPFRLRQDPGPRNPLGRIKFDFPNRHVVYVHDTPARTLFDCTQRSFSHGCIRIEQPFELAVALLEGDPEWTPAAIRAAIDGGETREIRLRRTMPIHVTYQTARLAADGTVHFFPDHYDRDAALDRLLRQLG